MGSSGAGKGFVTLDPETRGSKKNKEVSWCPCGGHCVCTGGDDGRAARKKRNWKKVARLGCCVSFDCGCDCVSTVYKTSCARSTHDTRHFERRARKTATVTRRSMRCARFCVVCIECV